MSTPFEELLPKSFSTEDMQAIMAAATRAVADDNGRFSLDPEAIERDLAKLVLVVVELLRRLMEHQALARMDRGTLSDRQIDQLSDALYRAQNRVEDLRIAFDIPAEEFNVDLGPLGKIL
ncbi:MAG: gas vesicle protein K [Pseudomonadota bacterium]